MTQAKSPEPMKPSAISQAVGTQITDFLNEGHPGLAATGRVQDDGSYEFLLGPVFLPHGQIKLAAPEECRLFVNLRVEHQRRAGPQNIRWMCKRGDDHVLVPSRPEQAIVVEKIDSPADEDAIYVYYHLSRG